LNVLPVEDVGEGLESVSLRDIVKSAAAPFERPRVDRPYTGDPRAVAIQWCVEPLLLLTFCHCQLLGINRLTQIKSVVGVVLNQCAEQIHAEDLGRLLASVGDVRGRLTAWMKRCVDATTPRELLTPVGLLQPRGSVGNPRCLASACPNPVMRASPEVGAGFVLCAEHVPDVVWSRLHDAQPQWHRDEQTVAAERRRRRTAAMTDARTTA